VRTATSFEPGEGCFDFARVSDVSQGGGESLERLRCAGRTSELGDEGVAAFVPLFAIVVGCDETTVVHVDTSCRCWPGPGVFAHRRGHYSDLVITKLAFCLVDAKGLHSGCEP